MDTYSLIEPSGVCDPIPMRDNFADKNDPSTVKRASQVNRQEGKLTKGGEGGVEQGYYSRGGLILEYQPTSKPTRPSTMTNALTAPNMQQSCGVGQTFNGKQLDDMSRLTPTPDVSTFDRAGQFAQGFSRKSSNAVTNYEE